MPELPHFTWPFQLGETVQQDTFDDRGASAAVILCTPRGQREDVPTFGVTTPLFEAVPADLDLLASELLESDPRLDAELDDVTELVDATTARLTIDLTGE